MRYYFWFAVLVSLLGAFFSPLTTAGELYHTQIRFYSPTQDPREGSLNNEYYGTVTALSKNSITIQLTTTLGEKPKTFIVSETLAAGKVPKVRRVPAGQFQANPMMYWYMYRLTDVNVGDLVAIIYSRIDGVDICDHICINRRPGGLVPPLQKEAEDLGDFREVWKMEHPGKPVPLWFAKVAPVIPYHERMNAYWAKIAPMPRKKVIESPPISP